MPYYVKKAKPMDGLCPYHMNAWKMVSEVKRLRRKWHFVAGHICLCDCVRCSPAGCDHEKKPLGDFTCCTNNTCERCARIYCLVEYIATKYTVWYTSVLEKHEGGGLHWIDEAHPGSRLDFMQYVEIELAAFRKHDDLVNWVKKQVDYLKYNLPIGHVVIKVDFIQNMFHQRAYESTTSY